MVGLRVRRSRLEDGRPRADLHAELLQGADQHAGVGAVDVVARADRVGRADLELLDLPGRARREPDVGDVQTGAHVERADAVVGTVEVARRVAVDARLAARREAGGSGDLERPLEETAPLPAPGAGDEDHVRRLDRMAGNVTRVPEEAVRRPVVALLVAFDHTVPARLGVAGGRAAVAGRRVTVVAFLARLDDVVAADGGGRTREE